MSGRAEKQSLMLSTQGFANERHCCHLTSVCTCVRAAQSSERQFKTSVVFSVMEGPGQLFKALSVFALRDLDMTKIESRPMRSNPVQLANGTGARNTPLLAPCVRSHVVLGNVRGARVQGAL